jgi:hypothetical protein
MAFLMDGKANILQLKLLAAWGVSDEKIASRIFVDFSNFSSAVLSGKILHVPLEIHHTPSSTQ